MDAAIDSLSARGAGIVRLLRAMANRMIAEAWELAGPAGAVAARTPPALPGCTANGSPADGCPDAACRQRA